MVPRQANFPEVEAAWQGQQLTGNSVHPVKLQESCEGGRTRKRSRGQQPIEATVRCDTNVSEHREVLETGE